MQNLIPALVKFNSSVSNVAKDAKADRYRYATLAQVLDTIRQPLADCGLAVTQAFDDLTLVTTLWHISGEMIESRMTIPSVEARGMNSAQAMGSAISYARRYAILALLNLATEDDDAQSAGHSTHGQNVREREQRSAQPRTAPPAPQAAQQPPAILVELVREHNIPTAIVKEAIKEFGYSSAAEIPEAKLGTFCQQLLGRFVGQPA